MKNIILAYQDGSEKSLTVTSAIYGDAANTSILLSTVESGLVCVSKDQESWWSTVHAELTINTYVASSEEQTYPYEAAVQRHMDNLAFAAGYDDIKTAVTYADEPAVAKFQQEGQAFRAWRSLCWAYCYEQLAAVQTNQRPQPTVEELLGELPTLLLPAV